MILIEKFDRHKALELDGFKRPKWAQIKVELWSEFLGFGCVVGAGSNANKKKNRFYCSTGFQKEMLQRWFRNQKKFIVSNIDTW